MIDCFVDPLIYLDRWVYLDQKFRAEFVVIPILASFTGFEVRASVNTLIICLKLDSITARLSSGAVEALVTVFRISDTAFSTSLDFNSERFTLIDQQVPVFACALKAASTSVSCDSVVVVSYVTFIEEIIISSYVETLPVRSCEPLPKLEQKSRESSFLSNSAWTAPTTGGFVFMGAGFPKAEIAAATKWPSA